MFRKGQISQVAGIPVELLLILAVVIILMFLIVPAILDSKSIGNLLWSALSSLGFGG